jgi:hypothetical protein
VEFHEAIDPHLSAVMPLAEYSSVEDSFALFVNEYIRIYAASNDFDQ